MRFNEALCQSMPPMHFGLQNNNQLRRSSSEVILNDKNETLSSSQDTQEIRQEFYLGRNTTLVFSTVRNNNKIHEHNLNNNLDNAYNQSSSVESLADYESYYEESEDQLEEDPEEDEVKDEEEHDNSDISEYSEDGNLPVGCRGIVNPNYPGFQHLGPSLLSDTDDTDEDERELEDDESLTGEDPVQRDDLYNNNNNNNNIVDEAINRLDAQREEQKQFFYEKPKFNIERVSSLIECMNNYIQDDQDSCKTSELYDQGEVEIVQLTTSVKEILQFPEIEKIPDSSKNSEVDELEEPIREEPIDLIREANALKRPAVVTTNPFLPTYASTNPFHSSNLLNNNDDLDEYNNVKVGDLLQTIINPDPEPSVIKLDEIDLLANIKNRGPSGPQVCSGREERGSVPDVVGLAQEMMRRDEDKDEVEDSKEEQVVPVTAIDEKKEKMLRNQARKRQQQIRQDNKRRNDIEAGGFDVYNIETMPKIDMDAIENHLKAAREEERRRRTDREEIRRRLAMGPDADDLRNEKGRKPSLQSRLQSGMNLQICFMNDTSSDTDSVHGGRDSTPLYSEPGSPFFSSTSSSAASSTSCSPKKLQAVSRPQVLSLPPLRLDASGNLVAASNKKQVASVEEDEADFFARQARLQTEARMALAQAKEMAHMQMEVERQKLKQNPITEMVRDSLQKIGVNLGEERRRLTRNLLTDLNIAQLQVLANDLHARIATLNEALVEGLLRRDDLHMEQDSMLVDVEDLTRYLGAKEESILKQQQEQLQQQLEKQKQQQQQQKQQQPTRAKATGVGSLNNKAALLRSLGIFDRAAVGKQLVANLMRK